MTLVATLVAWRARACDRLYAPGGVGYEEVAREWHDCLGQLDHELDQAVDASAIVGRGALHEPTTRELEQDQEAAAGVVDYGMENQNV